MCSCPFILVYVTKHSVEIKCVHFSVSYYLWLNTFPDFHKIPCWFSLKTLSNVGEFHEIRHNVTRNLVNTNYTGNIDLTQQWGAFEQPLLLCKTISIAYCECVFVALVIQHAMRVRPVILSSVACPGLHYFSTLTHEGHDFRKKKLLNIKCAFLFPSTPPFWKISCSKKNWER